MSSNTFISYAARLREFITRTPNTPTEVLDSQFNTLALDLFQLQFESNSFYRYLCAYRGTSLVPFQSWQQIPAVPTSAFKEFELTTLKPNERTHTFHSSGTTESRPSRHFHNSESLALYEASLLPWFQKHLLPEGGRIRIVLLTPPASSAPNSSLAHMGESIMCNFGTNNSSIAGDVEAGKIGASWIVNFEQAFAGFENAIAQNEPVLVFGTAFSFVHLLDYLADKRITLQLPTGSRIMETGGYKGKSRELAKAELHRLICERLGIAESHVVCEYGMSELSSQAYDRVAGSNARRVFQFPPWARVRVISPETGGDVPEGDVGLIQITDLANARSVMSVLTEDLGTKRENGFELIGRAALAEARGCSLMLK